MIHNKTFPNEKSDYRSKRNELLQLEIDSRALTQKMNTLRAQLPLGGLAPQYYFESQMGKKTLRELFGKHNSLILYSFMYSEGMKSPCPACSSLMDGFNGMIHHLKQRTSFYAVSKSPLKRTLELRSQKNWENIEFISSSENTYNQDYHAENDSYGQIPALNVFTLNNDKVYHSYNTEILYAPLDGHPRHVDSLWPIWGFLDLIPEGRGDNWFPQLNYD